MIELYNVNEPYDYILECDREPEIKKITQGLEDKEALEEDKEALEEEKKEHIPTIWQLKRLSLEEERFLSRMASELKLKNRKDKFSSYTDVTLHIGLVGVGETKGAEAAFKRDEDAKSVFGNIKPWTNDTLAQIDRTYRDELASEILGMSKLKVPEVKNS